MNSAGEFLTAKELTQMGFMFVRFEIWQFCRKELRDSVTKY